MDEKVPERDTKSRPRTYKEENGSWSRSRIKRKGKICLDSWDRLVDMEEETKMIDRGGPGISALRAERREIRNYLRREAKGIAKERIFIKSPSGEGVFTRANRDRRHTAPKTQNRKKKERGSRSQSGCTAAQKFGPWGEKNNALKRRRSTIELLG